jgi:hypothetical protein
MVALDLWGWGDRSAFGSFGTFDRSMHYQRPQGRWGLCAQGHLIKHQAHRSILLKSFTL